MNSLNKVAAVAAVGFTSLFLAANPGSAAMISGSGILQLGNGSVQVTGNGTTNGCINWYNGSSADGCNSLPNNAFTVQMSSSNPPFTGNSTGTILDLPFNVGIPLVDFVVVNNVHFDLLDIRRNGPTDIGSCTAPGSTQSGATCTPADSPFQLLNGLSAPGQAANTVGVQFTVDLLGYTGTKTDGFTNYIGIFTTQSTINGNIATVLQTINNGGSVSSAWAGSFSPTTTTPEPASMFLFGAGLLGIGFTAKRFRSTK